MMSIARGTGVPLGALAAVLCGVVGLTWPVATSASAPRPPRAAPANAPAAAMAQQVRLALDERRLVDAADLLDRAAVMKLSTPELIVLRGDLMLARDRAADALVYFRAAGAESHPSPEALQGEGLALSMLGRSDEALPNLLAATKGDRTLWRAWNGLGREYDLRRDWPKAEAAYAVALAAPGANPSIVLNNRGFSRLMSGKLDLAAADFVAALEKDPSLAAARTNLRITLASEGAYARASATGAGDDRAAVLNNVGLAAAMRGDYLQADKLLREAMEARGQYYARAAENLQLSHELASRADESPAATDGAH